MINYNDIDKFYTGIEMPVIMNCGGMFLEVGENIDSLFYKINDDYYADVNHKGRLVQVLRMGTPITSSYVLEEDSLVPVKNKQEIIKNSDFVKRLTFKPINYKQSQSK